MRDNLIFLGRMARRPTRIGAVAPSGKALGKAMAEGLGPDSGNIVEYGAGTGTITQAIVDRGVKPENLCVFEIDPVLLKRLNQRFPTLDIRDLPAQHIAQAPFDQVDTVVSSLPLLSFSRELQHEILSATFTALPKGAPMVQFTYSTKPPIPARFIEEFGLSVEKRRRVFLNMPPATVFVFRQSA